MQALVRKRANSGINHSMRVVGSPIHVTAAFVVDPYHTHAHSGSTHTPTHAIIIVTVAMLKGQIRLLYK